MTPKEIRIALAIIFICFFFGVALGAYAQDQPAAKATDAPAIPEDAKKALVLLQKRAEGLEDAKALLQKEIDAITADFNRVIARLQAAAPAGYELGPNLTYVKKKS